jgi:hypothetical protein
MIKKRPPQAHKSTWKTVENAIGSRLVGAFFYYLFWRARPTGKLWKNASWLCCLFVWPFAADNENIWVV